MIFLFSKKKTTKDRKISLKDIVQNNDSRILKSVDACIEVETLPFVDLYLSLAGQSSNSNVYMVSILFLNRERLTKLFHRKDVGNEFLKVQFTIHLSLSFR